MRFSDAFPAPHRGQGEHSCRIPRPRMQGDAVGLALWAASASHGEESAERSKAASPKGMK